MDSKTRREVVATLIKAGRRDLANQFVVKALWMPTAEIKKLIGYSSAISSATRAV